MRDHRLTIVTSLHPIIYIFDGANPDDDDFDNYDDDDVDHQIHPIIYIFNGGKPDGNHDIDNFGRRKNTLEFDFHHFEETRWSQTKSLRT